jgi:hypothetical protein
MPYTTKKNFTPCDRAYKCNPRWEYALSLTPPQPTMADGQPLALTTTHTHKPTHVTTHFAARPGRLHVNLRLRLTTQNPARLAKSASRLKRQYLVNPITTPRVYATKQNTEKRESACSSPPDAPPRCSASYSIKVLIKSPRKSKDL